MKEIKNRKCLAKKNPEEICVVLANYATGSKKFGQSFGEICSISNLLVFEKFEKNSVGSPKNENLSGRVTFVDSEVKVNSWRYQELERKSVFAFV